MKGVAQLAVLVVVGALFVAGCGSDSEHRDGARTYYESLDLGSPASAVETISGAFARDDFMAVWLSFGRHAQTRLTEDLNLLQYGDIIGPDAMDDLRAWFQNDAWFETLEYPDAWWIFDQIMLIADSNDAFLIDLSGEVTIENEEITGDTAIVLAEVSGIMGDVEFHLRESATGRWQVDAVSAPGAEDGAITWPRQPGT